MRQAKHGARRRKAATSEGQPLAHAAAAQRSARHVDPVFEALRARIANHELLPGSKLRETELAKEFGVSRTRVREVLGGLEQRGLIERIPNQGAVVARLDLKQISNIFSVRIYLEGLCIRQATLNAPSDVWRELLSQIGASIEDELSRGEFGNYISYLHNLRSQMIRYSENDLLATLLDLLYDKAEFIAKRVLILPGRWRVALDLHRKLLRTMTEGDADKAEKIRRQILSSAHDAFEKYKDFVL
jgi:DNA-binding GntR family transcriptional regulator